MKISYLGIPLLALLLFGFFLIGINSYLVFDSIRFIAYPKIYPLVHGHKFFLIGVFLGLYSIGSACLTLFFGGLSDRIGRRKVFLLSMMIWAIGYLVSGVGAGFAALGVVFLGQFLSGAGDSFRPLAYASLADLHSDPYQRMRSFGIFASADAILAGIFFVLDFHLIHREIPLFTYPIIPFFTTAIVGVFVWIVIYLNFVEAREVEEKSWHHSFRGFGNVFKTKGIARLFFLYFLAILPFLTLEESHSSYMFEHQLTSRFHIMLLYLSMSIGWFGAACFLFPYLVKRCSIGKIFHYAFVVYLIFWILSPIFLRSFFLYSLPFFTGVLMGLLWPSLQGLISLITSPENQGKAMTVCYFILVVSAFLGPLLLRQETVLHPVPFYIFITICVIMGICISFSFKKYRNNLG